LEVDSGRERGTFPLLPLILHVELSLADEAAQAAISK
jgi:hypothetical protein